MISNENLDDMIRRQALIVDTLQRCFVEDGKVMAIEPLEQAIAGLLSLEKIRLIRTDKEVFDEV